MCSDHDGLSGSPALIDVRGVSKAYRIYRRPIDRLKQAFAWGRRQYYHDFLALDGVDLQVRPGEMVGIIGRNGSGKSTLLQIVAGTLAPSAGEVRAPERVAALLELGSGFDMEATGRENVYMNAAILGLPREEIDRKYDSIAAFADIGEFVDQPIKTYSSGMVVRLAFAVAAHVDAAALIVDEALAVGDAPFQAKCFRRIEALRKAGVPILLATHDMTAVASMCDRALLLEHGHVVMSGPGKAVAEEYYRRVREIERQPNGADGRDAPESSERASAGAARSDGGEPARHGPASAALDVPVARNGTRLGDGRAEVVGFGVFDAQGEPTRVLRVREPFRVDVRIRFATALRNPHVGAGLRDVQSRLLLGGHTLYEGATIGAVDAGRVLTVSFDMQMNLNPGRYLLMLGVAEHEDLANWKDCDVFFDLCEIGVVGKDRAWCLVDTPVTITVRDEASDG